MGFEIPARCTLPSREHPLRQAEFEALFANAVDAHRLGPLHVRVSFRGDQVSAASVRDLAGRESACCSFFDFTVSASSDHVVLDVRVPQAHAQVLEGIVKLAAASAR